MIKSVSIITPRYEINALILQQYTSLLTLGYKVYWGMDFFWEPTHQTDLYIIHWPENLTNRHEGPTNKELTSISERFFKIKETSKVIVYFHNEYPHYRKYENLQKLYNLVYTNSDYVIHLGEYSMDLYDQIFPDSKGTSIVIPHPIYDSLPNTITKSEARKKLKIQENEKVCLVFGSIRNKEEVKMILKAFKRLKISNKKLLVVKGPILHYQGFFEKIYSKIYIKYHVPDLIYYEGNIDNDDIQVYVNAADIIFIHRKKSLNSGLLPLAFTFGKVVVGPKIGNIGEILENTENPSFFPDNTSDIVSALKKGFELSGNKKGNDNLNYGLKHWNQLAITKELLNKFSEL